MSYVRKTVAGEVPHQIQGRLIWAHGVLEQALDALDGTPEEVEKALKVLAPAEEPALPSPWPRPSAEMRQITAKLVELAVPAVKRQAAEIGLGTVYTGLNAYPIAALTFEGSGKAPDFAPLLTFCLDATIFRGLNRLVIEAHSRLTRGHIDYQDVYPFDAYPGAFGEELMIAVNQFLLTEITLWAMASDGGFVYAVPYPVRYNAAAYLWSPDIPSTAFCLRCGEFHRLRRAGRRTETHPRTVPVCQSCLRSGITTWPSHAVMPDVRGKWWLRCSQANCSYVFVGPGQAKKCPTHKHRNLSRQQRRKSSETDDTQDYFEI